MNMEKLFFNGSFTAIIGFCFIVANQNGSFLTVSVYNFCLSFFYALFFLEIWWHGNVFRGVSLLKHKKNLIF